MGNCCAVDLEADAKSNSNMQREGKLDSYLYE